MFTLRSSLCAAAVLAVLCGAACGTPSASPGVASLGSGSATSTTAKAASDDQFSNMLAFSACMRSHGVKDFPDPTKSAGGGGIRIQSGKGGGGSDLDPNSAVFQAAQRACQSLLPKGGPNGTKVDPTKIEPWAACIRSHGVPNFPDPTTNNGALSLNLTGTGIQPDSSQFQNAMKACRPLNPGGGMMVQAGPGGSK